MKYEVLTPATTVPVSTTDLNTHLMLFGDDSYDSELEALLLVAQEYVSNHLGEFVSDTVVKVPFNSFGDIELIHKNVTSISVHYYDDSNNTAVLPTANYVVDDSGIHTVIKVRTNPTDVSNDFDNVGYIQYTTGYSNVPKSVSQAILITAAELFEVRSESTEVKRARAELTIQSLLQSFKRW